MNLLNINLIRKKSQEFYKIIPEFYQSAPCMIVRRVLVLIQVRLATLAARQAHVFFQPIRYNDSFNTQPRKIKGAEVCR